MCAGRYVQAPSKTRAKSAAKLGSDFALHLGAEDPGLDRANRVGCGTLPRLPRTFFQTAGLANARHALANPLNRPSQNSSATNGGVGRGARADTIVRGQAPERRTTSQTSGDRRLAPSKLLV